jgi:hypothetical protein
MHWTTSRQLTKLATRARLTGHWANGKGGETLKDLATRRVLQELLQSRKLGSIDRLVSKKQRVATYLLLSTVVSLVLTVAIIELRLQRPRDAKATGAIEVLRTCNLVLMWRTRLSRNLPTPDTQN